jgi:hypothetical protein
MRLAGGSYKVWLLQQQQGVGVVRCLLHVVVSGGVCVGILGNPGIARGSRRQRSGVRYMLVLGYCF